MACFLVTCLFVHRVLAAFNPTIVIAVAFILQAIATLMIGPSHLLRAILPDKLSIIISGLVLTGLAGSFTSIGAYTEMHDPYVNLHPNCDKNELSDILSGLYNAGFSLGTFVGPMAASYITLGFKSFRICTDFFAIFTLIFASSMIFFVYFLSRK
jgi:hypothetical protein